VDKQSHFPTEAEKSEDARIEKLTARRDDNIFAVLGFFGTVLKIVVALAVVDGLVAFIKWCWIHS
jgi:hypothetical protein